MMLLICALASGCAPLPASLTLLEGRYDNLAQVDRQVRAGVPEALRNRAIVLRIRRVPLPAFGSQTVYAEWRDAHDDNEVVRQRIYAADPDPAGRVELKVFVWPLNNPALRDRTAGAIFDPAKLRDLTPGDMAPLKGCDIHLRAGFGAYVGAMKKGTCRVSSPDDGTPLYSRSRMQISQHQFRYRDRWYRLDGSVYRRFGREWYDMRKTAQSPTD